MSTDLNTGSSIFDSHAAIDAALTKLSGLGRLDEAHAIVSDVADKTNYGAIDADQTHTADAKLDMYAHSYAQTMNTVAQRLSRAADIARTQAADDQANAFGVSPYLAVSARDAGDRAQAVTNPRDRQNAIANAVADGDTVYAAALAKSAIAAGDLASVNTYSDAYPHLDPSLQRLWDAARQKNDPRALGLAAYNAKDAMKPGAISHLAAFQIDARAQRKAVQQ